MDIEGIISHIDRYKEQGKKLFVTSSFQANSIPLLHIISRIDNDIAIYFFKSENLHPDTLKYREKITKMFNLNVLDVHYNAMEKQHIHKSNNNFLVDNPDYWCYINKSNSMRGLLGTHDIWINNLHIGKLDNNQSLKAENDTYTDAIQYLPLFNWTDQMIESYKDVFQLPQHPKEQYQAQNTSNETEIEELSNVMEMVLTLD